MAGQPKQFGLILPKKNQLSAPKAINVFGDDSDLDEDDGVDWVQKSLKAEGKKNRIKKQARINAERALAEDPTIYQYDEIYSEIHVDTKKKKEEKKKQEPKYIGKLLQNAEKRKRENEIRIERMVQKEREDEGDMFKDKEKFVTASYRKKLEENKQLEAEEKERERLEAIGDVTKQVNIDGFYRHFFNQTFEVGAKKEIIIKDPGTKKESEDKIEKEKSNKQNLDVDDSSVNDSSSDDQENKTEALKIVTKNRKGKQYRKRVAEISELESEEEKEKEEDKNSKTSLNTENSKDKNIEERTSTPEIKPKDKEENEDKEAKNKENIKNVSSKGKQENEAQASNVSKPRKAEKKTSIWEKRTVGPVFEAALQRYYARQAMKMSDS